MIENNYKTGLFVNTNVRAIVNGHVAIKIDFWNIDKCFLTINFPAGQDLKTMKNFVATLN